MSNADIILTMANIKSHVERLKHLVYDAWKKKNADFNAEGGQVTAPSALVGAKQAMNDKYGPGTVVW